MSVKHRGASPLGGISEDADTVAPIPAVTRDYGASKFRKAGQQLRKTGSVTASFKIRQIHKDVKAHQEKNKSVNLRPDEVETEGPYEAIGVLFYPLWLSLDWMAGNMAPGSQGILNCTCSRDDPKTAMSPNQVLGRPSFGSSEGELGQRKNSKWQVGAD